MYRERNELYKDLEHARDSRVLTYVTGTRPGREAQISAEVLDFFSDHLDMIGPCRRISLVLHTNGGDTLAGWSIVNMIRMFCDELEVIIPFKALSTGTLIAIGADKIIMTKQAALGPIDPSTNSPFNPQFPVDGTGNTVPVSVEFVAGFLELAKSYKTDGVDVGQAFQKLCDKVHPLALGQVFRTRNQIEDLAKRLLAGRVINQEQVQKIVSFLCRDSGSHDYTINRREALDMHGLQVEKPDAELYSLIRSIYKNFAAEMKFAAAYSQHSEVGDNQEVDYSHVRGLIESVNGGSHFFVTRGKLRKASILQQVGMTQQPVEAIIDQPNFEGWQHEN